MSFLLPSLMVQDSPIVEEVEKGMMRLHITILTLAVITLILVVLCK